MCPNKSARSFIIRCVPLRQVAKSAARTKARAKARAKPVARTKARARPKAKLMLPKFSKSISQEVTAVQTSSSSRSMIRVKATNALLSLTL